MTEVGVRDLLAGTTPVGSEVTLKGWVRTRRDSKQGFSCKLINENPCLESLLGANAPGFQAGIFIYQLT